MDATIRTKIDKHIISTLSLFYRTIPKGSFEIMPHWIRGFSGVDIPTYNIFMPLDKAGLNDDTLSDTEAFFASHDVFYTIELIHDRIPTGPDFLARLRYQSFPPQPAMYLTKLPANINPNPNLTIERVKTVPSHTAFYTLQHAVFDFDLQNVKKLFPVVHLDGEILPIIRHYLAFVDDQPVAAGTVTCKDDVASISNLCTADEYRRQGIATRLLYHMLQEAHQDGFTIAMLYSTAQAFQLFQKCGFEIYTQRQWFLQPGLGYEE